MLENIPQNLSFQFIRDLARDFRSPVPEAHPPVVQGVQSHVTPEVQCPKGGLDYSRFDKLVAELDAEV